MKTKRLFLLTAVILQGLLTANAEDFSVDGIHYNITSEANLTVEVTYQNDGTAYSGAINIPSTVTHQGKTYNVTAIGRYAFQYDDSLTEIGIPEGITTIGDYAFHRCTSLVIVTIPKSLTTIGTEAFYGCWELARIINCSSLSLTKGSTSDGYIANKATSITPRNTELFTVGDFQFYTNQGKHYLANFIGADSRSITLPNNYNGENYIIDDYALYGHDIKSLTIGSGVVSIAASTVCSKKPIKTIWLPNTPPTSVGYLKGDINYASNSDYGTSKVEIFSLLSSMFEQDGVKYVIESTADRTCRVIDCAYNSTNNTVNIGEKVVYKKITLTITEIMPYAFYDNDDIKEVYVKHNGNIQDWAFSYCDGIQTVDVSNQGYIGDYAFSSCGIQNIKASNQGYIGDNAFMSSVGMQSIEISNLGDIGKSAFEGCSGDQTIIKISNQGNIGGNAFYEYTGMKSVHISNQGNIESSAFYNCKDLQTATIENTGTIASLAFQSCSALETATLGNNVTEIHNEVFKYCTSLQSIVIPNSVTRLGTSCFAECTAMKSASIGTGLTTLEQLTFYNCKELETVKLGENITSIKSQAFDGCKKLAEINLPEVTKSIGDYAFRGCATISEIIIPQATETIGNYVFAKCTNLQDVIFNDRTTPLLLGSNDKEPLFVDCPLDSVYIGGNISYDTGIFNSTDGIKSTTGFSPFHLNQSLRTVKIANGEDDITEYMFRYCSNLQHIYIGDDVASIGDYAFAYCISLPTISIPQSTKSVGDYAFKGCSKLSDVIIENRTETIELGHNDSSPLFADCPLDSVYIGGKISYSTASTDGYSPFYRNYSLRTVKITHNEETVYDNEFYGCTGLKTVVIGDKVTSIGSYAFSGCSALESFSFGNSMKNIGSEAFSDCTSMVDIISYATVPPTCGQQALADIDIFGCTLHVPVGYVSAYQNAAQWNNFFFIEENGVQTEYYTLSYKVDGEVYHTETYAYKAAVTMLAEPTKEGYTFSGWDKIITTMPNENVVINGTFTKIPDPTHVTITIGSLGSGTYCSNKALDFSAVEGMKAYVAAGYNNNTGVVTLMRVNTTQAGTGLFVKGNPGTYTVPIIATSHDNSLNMLVGTLTKTQVNRTSDDGLYINYKYTVTNASPAPKFYEFEDGSSLSAGKAYLQIPVVWLTSETKSISYRFDDGETTDLDEIQSEEQALPLYDLMGRQVMTPQKGGVYIKDGKKFVY